MNFFTDNYIWFICAGILVIMTIIGYIAEKTDFGHKEIVRKQKTDKKEKNKKMAKEIKDSNLKLNEAIYNKNENIEIIEEDLTVPLNKPVENIEKMTFEENLTVPLNSAASKVEEDLTVPLNYEKNFENLEENLIDPFNPTAQEDLTVPLNGSTSDIEKVEEEVKKVDDIWTF